MAKKKLQHFAEMKTFSCVFQPTKEEMHSGKYRMKGKWNSEYFKNDNPITLELGCGKGEYTIALAEKYPNRNFVGVDVKGARLWRGSKTANDEEMNNVAFLRTKIEFINTFFAENEVSEVWLTFSDPQPKDKKGTKRLTSHHFLKRYYKLLKPDGIVHIKTDSRFLYERSVEVIEKGEHEVLENSSNLYGEDFENFHPDVKDILGVQTFYEKKFMARGHLVHYLKFKLNDKAFKAE